MQPAANKSITHLPGLDGLRGLAALAVFGVHYNQIIDVDIVFGPFDLHRLLGNGEFGVALFFVLSGALLSMPFWQAMTTAQHWPDMRNFALHRIARIVPAYYLCLTLLLIGSGYWQHPQAWSDILLHYSFLFNLAEFSLFSINAPFWTLAVEMQFYLLLPLLFFALRRLRLQQIVYLLLVAAILAYGLHYWLVSSITNVIHWPGSNHLLWLRPYGGVLTHSLLAHLPHFILGMLSGLVLLRLSSDERWHQHGQRRLFDLLFWVCLAVVLLLLSTDALDLIDIPYGRYGLPLIPLLLAIMIISAPFTHATHILLESPPLHSLGKLSYGIYIYHLPILGQLDRRLLQAGIDAREHWLLFGISALVLSLMAAGVSYYLLEQPLLKRVRRSRR